jgi:hypothetical protein
MNVWMPRETATVKARTSGKARATALIASQPMAGRLRVRNARVSRTPARRTAAEKGGADRDCKPPDGGPSPWAQGMGRDHSFSYEATLGACGLAALPRSHSGVLSG